MNHETFMRRACELSVQHMTQGHGGPFGAVIVKNGEIVAEGWNQVTSTNDPTAHAEVSVIRTACKNLETFELTDCVIYTSCEPCPMCLAAIYWANIKHVYYGNTRHDAHDIGFSDADIYDEFAKEVDQRKIKMTMLCRDDAQQAFVMWEQNEDKTPY